MFVRPTVLGGILIAIIALCAACTIAVYVLIRKADRLLTYAEQLINVGAERVAKTPGKSAARTQADDDTPTGPIAAVQPLPQPAEDEWRTRFTFNDNHVQQQPKPSPTPRSVA